VVLHNYEGAYPNGSFGQIVRSAGDADADGFDDLLIAQNISGAPLVWLVSGRTGVVIRTYAGFSPPYPFDMDGAGDVDGDGYADMIAINNLANNTVAGVYSGRTGEVLLALIHNANAYPAFVGWVGSVGDVNNDGHADVMVDTRIFSGVDGSLLHDFSGINITINSGAGIGDVNGDRHADVAYADNVRSPMGGVFEVPVIRVFSGMDYSLLMTIEGPTYDASHGWHVYTIAHAGDVNADGVPDLIAQLKDATTGLPFSTLVYSGATGAVLADLATPAPNAFAAAGDVNADGYGDLILAYYNGQTPGIVKVRSGKDGSTLDLIQVAPGQAVRVSGAGDQNHDGFADFVVGTPNETVGFLLNAGVARVYSGSPCPPEVYCTPKINSLGCAPRILSSGLPSMSGSDNFVIGADHILNHVSGMLIWSLAPTAVPFGGGTLCLLSPLHRTGFQNSGGSVTGHDCTGTLSLQFSQAYLASEGLTIGTSVFAQWLYRDSGFPMPANVGLTDAVQFVVCP
jgi:hypothetical protein